MTEKQGECREIGCTSPTVILPHTSLFCRPHYDRFLAAKKELQVEHGLVCDIPSCPKQPHLGYKQCWSHWETLAELQRPLMSLEQIDTESDAIVDDLTKRQIGKYIVGVTCQRKSRLSAYIKDKKQKCTMETLIELKNWQEAALMEAAVVNKVQFHKDLTIRERNMNVIGGAAESAIEGVQYWLYVTTFENDAQIFRRAEISLLPEEVFAEMLEAAIAKIAPNLIGNRKYCIGSTARFENRMGQHNRYGVYLRVESRDSPSTSSSRVAKSFSPRAEQSTSSSPSMSSSLKYTHTPLSARLHNTRQCGKNAAPASAGTG
jgi:hypothetical protein